MYGLTDDLAEQDLEIKELERQNSKQAAAIDLALGALAEIAFNEDISLEVARRKAGRIYNDIRIALGKQGAP